jgi:hypothetical protein
VFLTIGELGEVVEGGGKELAGLCVILAVGEESGELLGVSLVVFTGLGLCVLEDGDAKLL